MGHITRRSSDFFTAGANSTVVNLTNPKSFHRITKNLAIPRTSLKKIRSFTSFNQAVVTL